MAEQSLHGVQVDARFEEVGGEGVAQGVDAALLADAGAELRQRIDLLGDRDVDRAGALAIGEEPDAGWRGRPVRAPLLQEARGEREVAIFPALAVLDPDGHAVGVDGRDLEGNRLADAQAGRVDGHQQQAMTRVGRQGEQPPDFFAAQDVGQLLGLLGKRHVKVGPRMAQRHVVEEAKGVRRLTTRAPGELALLDEVREVGLDFVTGDLVWGPTVVFRQADHGSDVRLVGARRETADGEVADHAGAELAHGTPPWSDELQGGDGASPALR